MQPSQKADNFNVAKRGTYVYRFVVTVFCISVRWDINSSSVVHLVKFFSVLESAFRKTISGFVRIFNPLNVELNPICHLLALLGGATIVVVSRLRVKRHFSLDFLVCKRFWGINL